MIASIRELYDMFYDWLIKDRRDLKIKEFVQMVLFVIIFMAFMFVAMCMP